MKIQKHLVLVVLLLSLGLASSSSSSTTTTTTTYKYTHVSISGWIDNDRPHSYHHSEDPIAQIGKNDLDPWAPCWGKEEWRRGTARQVLEQFGGSNRLFLLFIMLGRLHAGLPALTYPALGQAWIQADLDRAARYASAIDLVAWRAGMAAASREGGSVVRYCRLFGLLLPWLTDKVVAAIDDKCLGHMIIDGQDHLRQFPRMDETYINARVYERIFLKRPKPLFAALETTKGNQLTDLSPKQVGLILGPAGCALMTAELVQSLAEDPAYAVLLTATCAEQFRSDAVWEVGLRMNEDGSSLGLYLPETFFQRINITATLHDSWFKKMTRKHATNYQRYLNLKNSRSSASSWRCENFRINAANNEALAGIDEECFVGILLGYSRRRDLIRLVNDPDGDAERYNLLPEGIFRTIVKGSSSNNNAAKLTGTQILDAIDREEWQYMRTTQIEPLFEMESFCRATQVASLISSHHGDLKISGACWAQMSGNAQSQVLQWLWDLPLDLLRHAQPAKVREWQVNRGDQIFSKLLALEGIRNPDQLPHILTYLDDEAMEKRHLCSRTIDNMTDLLELGIHIRSRISADCFRDLGFKPTTEDLRWAPDLVPIQPFEQLAAGIHDLAHVDRDTFAVWADERGSFCRSVTADQANRISPDHYSTVGPGCTEKLVRRGGVAVDILNHIPPSSFAHLDAQTARMIDLERLSDDHFIAISAGGGGGGINRSGYGSVGSSSSSVFEAGAEKPQLEEYGVSVATLSPQSRQHFRPLAATFTATEVSRFSPSRVSRLNARILAMMPAEAFSGFTADQIRQLQPEAMVDLTREQVERFCCLKAFSPDQIGRVGINHKDSPQDPIPAFAMVISSMSEAHQETYRARSEGRVSAASLYIMTVCLLIGLYVAVL